MDLVVEDANLKQRRVWASLFGTGELPYVGDPGVGHCYGIDSVLRLPEFH